jgi:ribosomal protein L7/L12
MMDLVETLFILAAVFGYTWWVLQAYASLNKRLAALSRIDAKIDALLASAGITFDPAASLPAGVVSAIRSGQKIQAIKLYRTASGASFKEAKELVEEAQRRLGMDV